MKKEGTKIYIYRERIKNIAISIKKGKIILSANYLRAIEVQSFGL